MTRKEFLIKTGTTEIYTLFTEIESLEAVKQDGYALRYVTIVFDLADVKELTILQIEERLGYAIKVVK